MTNDWQKANEWEKNWWSSCVNTYGEEEKQLIYAAKMGLKWLHNGYSPYNIDMEGKSVMDVGCGPASMLLKCINLKRGFAVDPCNYPEWVAARYKAAGIEYMKAKAEDIVMTLENKPIFDEVWMYNVLQHTEDPEKIVGNLLASGKLIRVFEWVEIGLSDGHIHNLTEEKLNQWFKGEGKVEQLTDRHCFGLAYYGVFWRGI